MPYASAEAKKKNAKKWREANPTRCKELARAKYLRHREKRQEEGRRRYHANIERERERSRKYRREYPEKTAHSRMVYDLKAKYGLTPEGFDSMLASQGGRCANPACPAASSGVKGKRWHVDHDHETGLLRGILCHHCNVLIGYARDNPSILRGAALYLEAVLKS